MSVSIELSRIQTSRNTIRTKLIELGLATSTDTLDKLATAIEGIIKQGAISAQVKEGETYTIPAGYHSGNGTVSAVAGGGNYSLQSKGPITPTKKQQSVTSDSGYYGLSDVIIEPIPDAFQDVSSVTAAAEDVRANKIIVLADGTIKAGTMADSTFSKVLDATTITVTVPKGFHDGTGKVSITLETKTVTPTKSKQDVTPTAGKVLSKVTIEPIPDKYQDVSKVDAGANDVLAGKTIVDANGNEVPGAIPTNGQITATIDGITTSSYTIPAGHTTGGTVSLTNDIEEALAAI